MGARHDGDRSGRAPGRRRGPARPAFLYENHSRYTRAGPPPGGSSTSGVVLLETFQLAFVQRGVAEVLLLSVAAGLLGTWIVLRGLAFFSHAVGTAAFPGLVLADGLGFSGAARRVRRGGRVRRSACALLAGRRRTGLRQPHGAGPRRLPRRRRDPGERRLPLGRGHRDAALREPAGDRRRRPGPGRGRRGAGRRGDRSCSARAGWRAASTRRAHAPSALRSGVPDLVLLGLIALDDDRRARGRRRAAGVGADRRPGRDGAPLDHRGCGPGRPARSRSPRSRASSASGRRSSPTPRPERRSRCIAGAVFALVGDRPRLLPRPRAWAAGAGGGRRRRAAADRRLRRRAAASARAPGRRRDDDPARRHRRARSAATASTCTRSSSPTPTRTTTSRARRTCVATAGAAGRASRAATASTPGCREVVSEAGGDAARGRRRRAVPDRRSPARPRAGGSAYDPHWWHDPRNVEAAVGAIRDAADRGRPGRRAAIYARERRGLPRARARARPRHRARASRGCPAGRAQAGHRPRRVRLLRRAATASTWSAP